MINRIYIKILNILIDILDNSNKKKIIDFFVKKFKNKELIMVDIGAHKGETISLFLNNFNISGLYAIEPNTEIFKILQKKNFINNNKKIKLFNNALGEKSNQKFLNILVDSSSSTLNNLNEDSIYFKRKKFLLNPFKKNSNIFKKKIITNVIKSSSFFKKNSLFDVDILKIDTEGYEFNVLLGLSATNFHNIKYIYFEHHYDLMLEKNYNFSDINNLLNNNNFNLVFKIKMRCRKTFEYIYENKRFSQYYYR